MPQSLNIQIKTLTPLWTGGVDGTCDRLHVSGLVGSLRYWYEAIVRGVGGYACDPSEGRGCIYDKEQGPRSICAACYLFGTTGWARLFRLSASAEATEPLHFRTFPRIERGKMGDPNGWWLNKLFEKEAKPLSEQKVIYNSGEQALTLNFLSRSIEWKYIESQLKMLLWFLSNFAGLGARQQFGFGLFQCDLEKDVWLQGSKDLADFMRVKSFKNREEFDIVHNHETVPIFQPSTSNFFATRGKVEKTIIEHEISIPVEALAISKRPYLASAFDIRYKGDDLVPGFRQTLSNGMNKNTVDALFGAAGRNLNELDRSASKIFVSMPMLDMQSPHYYSLRIFGFATPYLALGQETLTALKMAWLSYLYLKILGAVNVEVALTSNQFTWGQTR